MQRRLALAAGLLAVLASPVLALEPPTTADQAFVDAFAAACVPGRLSYEATRDTAIRERWDVVERNDHPELVTVMQKSDEGLAAAEAEMEMTHRGTLFAREVNGTRHHLAVTQASFVIEEGDDPWVMVGCHLYNFDATGPVDPAPVTALIGNPISRTEEQDGMIAHVWGPPCPMPRTGDTYLSYVGVDGAVAQMVGFTGAALNFSTSTPDPGEEVPETYC